MIGNRAGGWGGFGRKTVKKMTPEKRVKRHIVGGIVDDVGKSLSSKLSSDIKLIAKIFLIKRNQTLRNVIYLRSSSTSLFVSVSKTETKLILWSSPPYRRIPFINKWIHNQYKLFPLPSITCVFSPLPRSRVLAPIIKTQKAILTPSISLRQRKFQEKKPCWEGS